MNLVEDAWIPIKRESGRQEWIAPWQITEPDDPILAVNAVRPDFNGALLQFLIGLIQTVSPPDSSDTWDEWLETPPAPELLRQHMAQVRSAFDLDGPGPRFMQDYNELEAKKFNPISELLIDSPGDNTIKENKDHFVKRGRADSLCPACAAMALFTLQINAPSGGQGHRTSLRGGGPLTTLVVLDPERSGLSETLWRTIWLNVLEAAQIKTLTGNIGKQEEADIFPWLAPTRTSEDGTGRPTTPMDAHPLQMYWSMPRRIRIDWQSVSSGRCGLCQAESANLVHRYATQNYGIQYDGSWQHPLSPYYVDNKGQVLPMHAQPGIVTYRHWLGMTTESDTRKPALVARRYRKVAQKLGEQFRLFLFGYDMDKMKARCWYETTFPLYLVSESILGDFSARVQALTDGADLVANAVDKSVKAAWARRPLSGVKGDTPFLIHAFYEQTEPFFYQAVERLSKESANGSGVQVLQAWHATLRQSALRLFDYWAERGDIGFSEPRRIALARQNLLKTLNGKKLCSLLQTEQRKGRKT